MQSRLPALCDAAIVVQERGAVCDLSPHWVASSAPKD